jgi:hypothetical protein
MALIETIRDVAREAVHALLGEVIERLDDIEKRLAAAEDRLSAPTTKAAPAPAKKAAPSTAPAKASSGTASTK